MAEIPDQIERIEDHVGSRAILHELTVEPKPETESARVGNLVGRDQPRTERVERLTGLALDPLPTTFELELALGNVVGRHVSGDSPHRLFRTLQVLGLRTNEDPQFDFEVGPARATRNKDVVVGTNHRVGLLAEDDRLIREIHTGLGSVISVVETYAKH